MNLKDICSFISRIPSAIVKIFFKRKTQEAPTSQEINYDEFSFEPGLVDDNFDELFNEVDKAIASGAKVIYFETLVKFLPKEYYETDKVTVIRDKLKERYTDFNFSYYRMFSSGEDEDLWSSAEAEILRIWQDRQTMTLQEILDLLPYVPLRFIKKSLSNRKRFMELSKDNYSLKKEDSSENMKLRETESSVETEKAQVKLQPKHKTIAGTYKPDVTRILTDYCLRKDECSVDEMAEFVRKVTDSSQTQTILRVLYGNMVRLDAKRFVADSLVKFDIDGTDGAIMSVSGGRKIFPVRSIDNFELFPDCGHVWNQFILESFCYRFSKSYRLRTVEHGGLPYFSNSNMGAIAMSDIDTKMEYEELLANVLANEKFELTEEKAGKFLYESGYTGKAKIKSLSGIIKNAQNIRDIASQAATD